NGGNCTVTDGASVEVPKKIGSADGSVTLSYSCTYGSAPTTPGGMNTATATWDSNTFFTPHGSANGVKSFSFAEPTSRINQTVTVTDSLGGALGELTATDSSPFASGPFTYPHAFTGTSGTCVSFDNTAQITQTQQSASQTVKVCVGADPKVSKTASPSFARAYTWDIRKSVDKTLVEQTGGGTAT